MSAARLKELLEKLPVGILFALYLAYLGYDYYGFAESAESPLQVKRAQAESLKAENVKLQDKITKAETFYRTLDAKRAEVRNLAKNLDEMKATLSEELDVAVFVKTVITEATRAGLLVQSIRPAESKVREFYVEQPFEFAFKGFFVQLMVFLERLSSLERIIRVDTFDIRQAGPSTAAYVELSGNIQIKTYKYVGSKADELVKTVPAAAPAAPAKAGGA